MDREPGKSVCESLSFTEGFFNLVLSVGEKELGVGWSGLLTYLCTNTLLGRGGTGVVS
jgi:hypothetical protein